METTTQNHTGQIIKQVLNAWTAQNKKVSDFFNQYEDDVYLKEIAPNKNRAIYLLGHLTAVNDGLLPLMGFGDKLYPELAEVYIRTPDRSVADKHTVDELKQKWESINETLNKHFEQLNNEDWLDRHMSVSPEDFKLQPMRNKLNVMIDRTVHQSYHLGQLNLMEAPVTA